MDIGYLWVAEDSVASASSPSSNTSSQTGIPQTESDTESSLPSDADVVVPDSEDNEVSRFI